MVSLLYMSWVARDLSGADLCELERRAAELNRERQVTGVSLRVGSVFLQVLEGPECVVRPLYEQICADRRHLSPVLLSVEAIPRREFSDWAMKRLQTDTFTGELLGQLFISISSRDEQLSNHSARILLRRLAEGARSAAIVAGLNGARAGAWEH